MELNMKQVMEDLRRTGEIGRCSGGGITRPGFSPAFREASRELELMMEDAGLKLTRDRVGNLFGRRAGLEDGLPAILMGSHLDTVIEGGLYDGNLGVISALEVIHLLNREQLTTRHPLEIVAFNAEEGSEMGGTFGSRVMTGRQNAEEEGLAGKLAACGLTLQDVKDSVRDCGEFLAFLELHIEQGACLDTGGIDIGIVDGIVGITRYQITVHGQSNHAGTTPMSQRRDPVVMAARLIGRIHDQAAAMGHPFVATVGDIRVKPGMFNVIPSDVTLFLELRDREQNRIETMISDLKDYTDTQKDYHFSYQLQVDKPSMKLSPEIMSAIEDACVSLPEVTYTSMWSGAGHDSKELVHLVPTGLIFVPSVGGISHSPEEFTTENQIRAGIEVLYDTVWKLDKK